MTYNNKAKLKTLYVKQILEEETDAEHGLPMRQIIERLEQFDIKAERKSIYNYVVYDSSTVEKPYALALDQSEQVKVFAKLPSKFKIDTPLGNYNPDWAYVEEVDGKERAYFVMETKGGGNGTPSLRPAEKAKIDCARKHFEALAIEDVTYDVETTYRYATA